MDYDFFEEKKFSYKTLSIDEIIHHLAVFVSRLWHIHYDEDYYGYLLSTVNLWENEVLEYASRTFYPNLPEEIKERYQINDLIKYIPKEAYRLEDY